MAETGKIENMLKERLLKAFTPIHLEIFNESDQHSGPGTETHFRVLMASQAFDGKSRLERQRLVQDSIGDLLNNPIHAFTQRLLTPEEFERNPEMPESPNCLGGSKNQ